MEGLLAWKPAMDSASPAFRNDCLTVVLEPNESLVTKNRGQVNLTQLNPQSTIDFEIKSTGCLLNPSATITSRCATQFTQASFTLCPDSSTIHREFVYSGCATAVFCVRKKQRRNKKIEDLNHISDPPLIIIISYGLWFWSKEWSKTINIYMLEYDLWLFCYFFTDLFW